MQKIFLYWIILLTMISCVNTERRSNLRELETQNEKLLRQLNNANSDKLTLLLSLEELAQQKKELIKKLNNEKLDKYLYSRNTKSIEKIESENRELRNQLYDIEKQPIIINDSIVQNLMDYMRSILSIDDSRITKHLDFLSKFGLPNEYSYANDSHEIICMLYQILNNSGNYKKTDWYPTLYLFKNLRSDRIISFFYKAYKIEIINCIKSNEEYKPFGVSNLVRCLLSSYDDLSEKPELLSNLYQMALSKSPDYNTYKGIITQKTENLLQSTQTENDLVWCYSFWVRRYHENSMKVIHDILVNLNNEL